MDFSCMTVLVAGLGISGKGAASVLVGRARRVITVDEHSPKADLSSFENVRWDEVDLVVVSPVFKPRTPFILEAQSRGIPVISEVELAWRLRVPDAGTGIPAPWVGITGTNGKTSTTQMVSSMLRACGLDAPAVGNIGMSVSQAAVETGHDVLCVELSSFQMHFTDSLRLECAAITNIAADHLDWHGGMDQYAADKAKVFHGVRKVLAYNADDRRVSTIAAQAQTAPDCRKVGFTLGAPKEGQVGVDRQSIIDMSGLAGGCSGVPRVVAPLADFPHLCEPDGSFYPHLLADALAALTMCLGLGADLERCVAALRGFTTGDHRIETVAVAGFEDASRRNDGSDSGVVNKDWFESAKGTIRFIDDSKATNASAAEASISSFPDGHVIWIAGGLAKGARFEGLVRSQIRKIKAVVIIGVDGGPVMQALNVCAPGVAFTRIDPKDNASVMRRAVEAAGAYAQGGDVVLMAPACASMDQFKSYADRGDQFAQCAKRWAAEHE